MVAFEFSFKKTGEIRPEVFTDRESLARSWLYESSLVQIRWVSIPASLLLIPFFPSVSVTSIMVLVLFIVVTNAWLTKVLSVLPSLGILNRARWTATAVDWCIGVGSVFMLGANYLHWTPGLLLLLILTTAFRFGHRGLVASAFAAVATVTGLVLMRMHFHDTYGMSTAQNLWIGWTLLIGSATAVGSGLVHAMQRYDRWEQGQTRHYGSALPRYEFSISNRQWEILQLIANDDLTYKQIGELLHLSPETIKTHVRNLGEKLGVSGRRQVVAAARQHGLLSPNSGS